MDGRRGRVNEGEGLKAGRLEGWKARRESVDRGRLCDVGTWMIAVLRYEVRASPSSRGLGRGPFKAETRVRIPVGTPEFKGWALSRRTHRSPTERRGKAAASVDSTPKRLVACCRPARPADCLKTDKGSGGAVLRSSGSRTATPMAPHRTAWRVVALAASIAGISVLRYAT